MKSTPESSESFEEKTQIKYQKHAGSFFWPIFLITLGMLLLLNNFNILPWSIWNTLWRFWPLLLILFGLEMIIGKGRLANVLITFIGLIILLTVLTINIPELGSWLNQTISQPNFHFSFPT